MRRNDEKFEEKTLKLEECLKKRYKDHRAIEHGILYHIILRDSRNRELFNFLNKNVNTHSLKDKKLLDIGCGMGGFLAYLQKKGIDAYGIDADAEMLRIGFAKNIIVGDIYAMPFKEETFDVVIGIDVFEHLQSQQLALQKMMSKIKHGGKLVLLNNNRLFPYDADTSLFFINYLPKKLAIRYLKIRRNNLELSNNPTYFTFSKCLQKKETYKIEVKGIFTVLGAYTEKYKRFRKIARIIENISYQIRFFQWIQWFAPKLCLIVDKLQK